MALTITDKVALVTGGARGIGAGIVDTLALAGAKVMIADIGMAQAENEPDTGKWDYAMAGAAEVAALVARHDQVSACYVDVTDPSSCADAVTATLTKFGQLDMLVNNAGVVDSGPIEQFEVEVWDRIFAVNSKGIFLMSQAALPHLRASEQACIINTASIAGKQGYPNMAAYCGSKFAAIGITQSLAAELAPDNIRVNAICPGMVGTAMWLEHLLPSNATSTAQKEEEFSARMTETIPLGRPQTPADMGEAVLYLATAPNVSGVALSVAGGFEMQ